MKVASASCLTRCRRRSPLGHASRPTPLLNAGMETMTDEARRTTVVRQAQHSSVYLRGSLRSSRSRRVLSRLPLCKPEPGQLVYLVESLALLLDVAKALN